MLFDFALIFKLLRHDNHIEMGLSAAAMQMAFVFYSHSSSLEAAAQFIGNGLLYLAHPEKDSRGKF